MDEGTAPDAAASTAPDLTAPQSLPPVTLASGLSPAPFGDARYGFVEATSANGRFVVLRRFLGTGPPQFEHHGDVAGGTELLLVDLTNLTVRAITEIIDVDLGTNRDEDTREASEFYGRITAVREALEIMIFCYDKMELTELAQQTRAMYRQNFEGEAGERKVQPKRKWYKLWLAT